MSTPAIHYTDGYKVDHRPMYPPGTVKIQSNFTPRRSRVKGVDHITFFGLQYFIKRYLVQKYNEWFAMPEDVAVARYKRRIDDYLGPKHTVTFDHVRALHRLQRLPITIKALPEGSRVPMRVMPVSITNTHPDFAWLVNYLETLMSCTLWGPSTSATTAHEFKRILTHWAMETVGDDGFVPFQAHDFSFRGMFGVEAAEMSGAGHLLEFVGTDTIPAIDFLEDYYGADSSKELIGTSVTATEHAVMCMGTGFYVWDRYKGDWAYQGEAELALFKRLITEVYPSGIISLVSDTWSLWRVVTEYMPMLKGEIMARDGKLVLRPDSSPKTPVEILVGDADGRKYGYADGHGEAAEKGLIRSLWETFGGTLTPRGYKLLDSHVGAIYGDSITMERAHLICKGLAAQGFASTNVVLGVGSYTYQYVTRDTYSWAMKATYGEVRMPDGKLLEIEIFKDPETDDGEKKSARGIVRVVKNAAGEYEAMDRSTWAQEADENELLSVFVDGVLVAETTLAEIRGRLAAAFAKETVA
jgi:nicotinamide phosphoribosyltransferase